MIQSLVLSLRIGLCLGLLGRNMEFLGAQKISLFRKKSLNKFIIRDSEWFSIGKNKFKDQSSNLIMIKFVYY